MQEQKRLNQVVALIVSVTLSAVIGVSWLRSPHGKGAAPAAASTNKATPADKSMPGMKM